jgi:hypothetical protein
MQDGEIPDTKSGRYWHTYVFAAGICLVGLLMAHHPMILSGLRRVQVDLGDSRLINYLLEHNYRWYRGDPNHADFWSPPFFYPARNIAAYSDTLIGVAPLYGVFRAAGIPPDTSFQLWMITLSVLNYSVMFHLLHWRLRLRGPAAAIGAFVFAFGSPRINMMVQQPQLTQFLSLLSVDALLGLFPGRDTLWWHRALLWLAAAAGLLAQLTSAFYIGWFTVFSLGIAAVVAVWMPQTRWELLAVIRRDALWLAVWGVLAALVMRPWLIHHLDAARGLGPRFSQFVAMLQPHLSTWLNIGTYNWLGGWAMSHIPFQVFRPPALDMPIGVGLLTTVVSLAGLYGRRDQTSTRLLVTVSAIVFLSVTALPHYPLFLVPYLLILGSLAFAYSGRANRPEVFFLLVALVLVFLNAKPYTSYLPGFGLYALVLAVAAFVGQGNDRRGRLILGGLIVGLSLTLIPSRFIMVLGAVFGCLLAGAARLLGWRSRQGLEAVGVGAFLLFEYALTYFVPSLPKDVLGVPMWSIPLFAPVAVAATRLTPIRPSDRSLVKAAFFGLLLAVIYGKSGSAWQFFARNLPGGSALLFVARVGLIMLIPWSIGIGFFLEAQLARKRPLVALFVGLACVLEQGVTTPSFDKYANRAVVSALARRIDDGCEAFYYSPDSSQEPLPHPNLDAMWAGLERGKPTLNGYSGHAPVGWRDFEDSFRNGPRDTIRLQEALDQWRKGPGRSVGRVQWLDGPAEWVPPAG